LTHTKELAIVIILVNLAAMGYEVKKEDYLKVIVKYFNFGEAKWKSQFCCTLKKHHPKLPEVVLACSICLQSRRLERPYYKGDEECHFCKDAGFACFEAILCLKSFQKCISR
jgi:hypothetical protein